TNELFAWSRDPEPAMTQLGFAIGQSAANPLTGSLPAPLNGQLRADAHFTLSVGGAAPVRVLVTAAATANNTEPADSNVSRANLLADINASLTASGVSPMVVAELDTLNHVRFATRGTAA